MIKKIAVIFLILLNFSCSSFSATAGTSLFYLLKLPQNAVQAALGGMSSFGNSVWFPNSAVIGLIDKCNISFSCAAHFQNTGYNSFSFAMPVYFSEPIGKVGLKVSYIGFDYGKMDRYLETDNGDYIKDGVFGANDAFTQVSLGYAVSKKWIYGVGFKYIWQDIDGSKLSGSSGDISVLFCPKSNFNLACGIETIGPRVEGYFLPTDIYVSYTNIMSDNFTFGFEFKYYADNTMWLKSGAGININESFLIRGGYSLPLDNDNKTLGKWYQRNLTLGFGVNIRFLSIDYAWLPFGELGSTNMISLKAAF